MVGGQPAGPGSRPDVGEGPAAARQRDDVADPGGHRVVHGAEDAAGDRLVAAGHPGPVAEHLPPRGQDVGRRAGLGVHVAGPRLAGEHPDAVGQAGLARRGRAGSRSGTSSIPWSAVTSRAASSGRPSTSCSTIRSTSAELGPPAGRVDAAHVPGEVELGDVAVDQGRAAPRPARVQRPAQRSPGLTGAGVGRRRGRRRG